MCTIRDRLQAKCKLSWSQARNISDTLPQLYASCTSASPVRSVMEWACVDFDNAYEKFVFELGVLVLFPAYDKDYPASEGDRGRSCSPMEAVGSQASKESAMVAQA